MVSSTSLLSQLPKPLQQGVGRHSRGARGLGAEYTAPHVWQRVFQATAILGTYNTRQGIAMARPSGCLSTFYGFPDLHLATRRARAAGRLTFGELLE